MKKFYGYCVFNTRTEKFVEYDCSESDHYEAWLEKGGAQQVLDEIDYQIANRNNKKTRAAKADRKNIKIRKLYLVVE
jgi:hypothetical protein